MPPSETRVHRRGGIVRLSILLLAVHCLWGAARIPTVVIGRRSSDVSDHRQRGAVGFFLDTPHQHGAGAVEWILANVPENGVVLFRGDSKGSLEFVPGLIAPRLLVAENRCPPGDTRHSGRPLASRRREDGDRVVVLAALGNDLRLEDR